ncbi:MAG: signal peptidase I [Treponema sp.]|jgi:signal peptidase I|nr:signal peptidase I [Treponema sp.]
MFDRSSHYSYAAQKKQRHRIIKYTLLFVSLFILYNCLTAFFFSVWKIDNNAMQPGINPGDRIVFSTFAMPYRARNTEGSIENNLPFKRGSIVLIDKSGDIKQSLPSRIADGIVRFFTMQKVSIFSGSRQYYIKRVIALPGDEVSMSEYIFRVKTGQSFSLTEFELSDKPYVLAIPHSSALWDSSVPFSGSMDAIILGPNECFVISDDRSNTNDSRTWGPISTSMIKAKAVLRFWPFNKIELF